MRTISVRKASPAGDAQVPTTTIHIDGEVPEIPYRQDESWEEWRDKYDQMYQQDAVAIVKALNESLPGGTFDRLLVEILKMKASHFRVPWGGK